MVFKKECPPLLTFINPEAEKERRKSLRFDSNRGSEGNRGGTEK